MTPELYQAFTQELRDRLQADERVLGLVAVGSMAGQDYQPDQWSDHDFFVIVKPGSQETFRSNFEWLPPYKRVVLSYRETAHGAKVLYEDGHLLEFAVFDPEELNLARVNRYRVLLDRGGIQARLEQIRVNTLRHREIDSDDLWLCGQFITNMLVGVGRFRRGEKLSGNSFVKSSGFRFLLLLFAKHIPSSEKLVLDDLDPHRRFEVAYPELGKELNGILRKEAPAAAKAFLLLAERELKHRISGYPIDASRVILESIK